MVPDSFKDSRSMSWDTWSLEAVTMVPDSFKDSRSMSFDIWSLRGSNHGS